MKSHIGSQVIFRGFYLPMKEIDERINELFCTAERSKQLHDPHHAIYGIGEKKPAYRSVRYLQPTLILLHGLFIIKYFRIVKWQ